MLCTWDLSSDGYSIHGSYLSTCFEYIYKNIDKKTLRTAFICVIETLHSVLGSLREICQLFMTFIDVKYLDAAYSQAWPAYMGYLFYRKMLKSVIFVTRACDETAISAGKNPTVSITESMHYTKMACCICNLLLRYVLAINKLHAKIMKHLHYIL